MPIDVQCECGRTLRAADRQAGKRCQCPGCGRVILVPMPADGGELSDLARAVGARNEDRGSTMEGAPPVGSAPSSILHPPSSVPPTPSPTPILNYADSTTRRRAEPLIHNAPPPLPVIAAPSEQVQMLESGWRGNGYWLLLFMMIPLAALTLRPHLTIEQRLQRTMQTHPNIAWGDISPEELTVDRLNLLLDQLPGHRLDGALLSRTSVWHWLMAMASAGLFILLVTISLPTSITPRRIFLTGLFTGTLGVITLLTIQFFGMFCCIGLFYAAALNPTAPFGPSLLGFILGIGVCEEIVKCLPVLWILFRGHLMSWREAAVIGMASGAGFGVTEGILYATRYYNGIEPADIYFVRFCSSVAFHTVLTGACAILIQRKQEHLLEKMDPVNWILTLTAIILIPIFLHGLFDTLAKENLPAGSLAVAVGSFFWLVWLIKHARARETIDVKEIKQGPQIVRTERGTRYIAPVGPLRKG